jgi:hypothetical protein
VWLRPCGSWLQLDAVLVTAPDDLRHRLAGLPKKRLVPSAARLRPCPDGITDVLRRIARRVEALGMEISEIDRALALLVKEMAPQLLVLRRARRHQPNRRIKRKAATPPPQPAAATANSTGRCT